MVKTLREAKWGGKQKRLDRMCELVDACDAAWRPKDKKALVSLWVRDDPATVLRVAANIVERAAMEGNGDGDPWLSAEAVTDMLRLMADKADLQENVSV